MNTLTNLRSNELCIKFPLLWVSDFGQTHIWAFSNYQTTRKVFKYYDYVIMNEMGSQITILTIVYSSVFRAQIKDNIKAPRHWPLCGEFIGDRWIPRTKVQLRGNCFHLMTSSRSVKRQKCGLYSYTTWFFSACETFYPTWLSDKQTNSGIFASFCRVFQNTMVIIQRKPKDGYFLYSFYSRDCLVHDIKILLVSVSLSWFAINAINSDVHFDNHEVHL